MATQTKTKTQRPAVVVSLGKFDSYANDPALRMIRSGIPIIEHVALTGLDYHPRGGTPLRDATADFIAHLDSVRSKDTVTIGLLADESGSMGGREAGVIAGLNDFVDGMRTVKKVDRKAAGKVMCVIVTDGLENSSKRVSQEQLQGLIREREADGWTFIYLGANQDAWDAGATYGFSGGATGQTVSMASSSPQAFHSALRTTSSKGMAYLGDQATYAAAAASESTRSINEDGSEVLDNVGAMMGAAPTPNPPPSDPVAEAQAEALARAKATLTGEDEED